jgi:hypothetical protein
MSSFRIRPRFTQTLDIGIEEARERIVSALAAKAPTLEVRSFPGYIGLHIPEAERHFWSPRLALHLEEREPGRTIVEGRYGPGADVWGMFVYGYGIVGSIGLFSGILGFAQRSIGADPWGLWIFGGAVGLAVLLYLAAQLGQKLGAWQTFQLHQAYQSAVGVPAEVR